VSRSFHPPPGPGASSACHDDRGTVSDADEGRGGWQLVQIAELLARIEQLGGRALRMLGEVDGDLAEDVFLTFSPDQLADLSALVLDAAQLAERLQTLGEALPTDEVEVSYPDVAAAAARDLAAGIIDVERVRLAARLLERGAGWRALAEGLEHADSHTAWEDATLADLLSGFRGVSEEDVRAIAADAWLTADAEIASCDPVAVVRLAASLEQYAASLSE
jgi:hypothetical protein